MPHKHRIHPASVAERTLEAIGAMQKQQKKSDKKAIKGRRDKKKEGEGGVVV